MLHVGIQYRHNLYTQVVGNGRHTIMLTTLLKGQSENLQVGYRVHVYCTLYMCP